RCCHSQKHQTRYGPMRPTFCLLPRVWFFWAGQWVAGVVKCPWPSALFEWLESRTRQRPASCVICTCRIAGRTESSPFAGESIQNIRLTASTMHSSKTIRQDSAAQKIFKLFVDVSRQSSPPRIVSYPRMTHTAHDELQLRPSVVHRQQILAQYRSLVRKFAKHGIVLKSRSAIELLLSKQFS
ncbi:MAG: hypothetical protein RJB13_1899, partial [Pseudomonadota bacterium]